MSDAKNTSTVEVPRELVDRLLALGEECFRPGNTTATELRACIKPRRWEREEWLAQQDGFELPLIVSKNIMGAFRGRIIFEEIV